jgi:lipid II isoglutaminyl synthase (glutamine-hydrolysing)
MPVSLTLLICKFALQTVRLLGRGGGSALPGLISEKLDPSVAAKLAPNLKEGSIVVTGTNGKTTTTKMIREILEASGKTVLTNRSGSNLYRGVASALIEKASLGGQFTEQIGLFEVDEASMPAVCAAVTPKVIIVLNLFRDQLDRYGELDKTAAMIGEALKNSKAEVWLNADDPLVASLASYVSSKKKVRYFGVNDAKVKKLAHDVTADSSHCPNHGLALKYTKNYFGHIGHYACPKGDSKRPAPEIGLNYGRTIQLETKNSKLELTFPLPGLYNAYNALAALAVASSLKVDQKTATEALTKASAAFGRVEELEIDGHRVFLLLIKNPTGFNQVIQTFLLDAPPSQLLIAINDNFADGRDVSWLWDVGIEDMKNTVSTAFGPQFAILDSQHQITCSGIRAYDMVLRLKYAGLGADVDPNIVRSFQRILKDAPPGQDIYVLPTYTAMLALRSKLKNVGEFWK